VEKNNFGWETEEGTTGNMEVENIEIEIENVSGIIASISIQHSENISIPCQYSALSCNHVKRNHYRISTAQTYLISLLGSTVLKK